MGKNESKLHEDEGALDTVGKLQREIEGQTKEINALEGEFREAMEKLQAFTLGADNLRAELLELEKRKTRALERIADGLERVNTRGIAQALDTIHEAIKEIYP